LAFSLSFFEGDNNTNNFAKKVVPNKIGKFFPATLSNVYHLKTVYLLLWLVSICFVFKTNGTIVETDCGTGTWSFIYFPFICTK
jgi:hypothetical protein